MDVDFNQSELVRSLKPFMDFLLSLKKDKPIPILRDLAMLVSADKTGQRQIDFLKKRLDRIYKRLCCQQKELGSLDLKKAYSSASQRKLASAGNLEDYVFSRIDFSRYREVSSVDFESFFLEGVADFPDSFFRINFRLGKKETSLLIKESYEKKGEIYKLQKETPLILSVMRTLETSLEASPLFIIEEIQSELDFLKDITGANTKMPEAKTLFSLLAFSLDNINITHDDEMITKLFIPPHGGLSGTFRPGDKPWTRVLVIGR